MTTKTRSTPELAPPPPTVPPLENGDRLTRAEFERRYGAMPELKKAELIEGIVYMPSPVSYRGHSSPHLHVNTALGVFIAATPGVGGGDNGSLRLDLDNMPQPDTFLIIEPESGGKVVISDDDYIEGAPELVAEIASSSASYDLHAKLHVYRRNGVSEYIVWRVRDEALDWFSLHEGRYEHLPPHENGVFRSRQFPGLWLDAPALLRGDLAGVLEVLRRGIESHEHTMFVANLRETAAKLAAATSAPRGDRP